MWVFYFYTPSSESIDCSRLYLQYSLAASFHSEGQRVFSLHAKRAGLYFLARSVSEPGSGGNDYYNMRYYGSCSRQWHE